MRMLSAHTARGNLSPLEMEGEKKGWEKEEGEERAGEGRSNQCTPSVPSSVEQIKYLNRRELT